MNLLPIFQWIEDLVLRAYETVKEEDSLGTVGATMTLVVSILTDCVSWLVPLLTVGIPSSRSLAETVFRSSDTWRLHSGGQTTSAFVTLLTQCTMVGTHSWDSERAMACISLQSSKVRLIHGLLFVGTFSTMTFLVSRLMLWWLNNDGEIKLEEMRVGPAEVRSAIGAVVCWIVLFYLYVCHLCQERWIEKHQEQLEAQEMDQQQVSASYPSTVLASFHQQNYGSMSEDDPYSSTRSGRRSSENSSRRFYMRSLSTMSTLTNVSDALAMLAFEDMRSSRRSWAFDGSGEDDDEGGGASDDVVGSQRQARVSFAGNGQTAEGQGGRSANQLHSNGVGRSSTSNSIPLRPFPVLFRVIIGMLDQLLFFSALVVGDIFNPMEMLTGAMLACLMVWLIILLGIRYPLPFGLVFFVLDRIPLYYVVLPYALLLSIMVLVQIVG